MYDMYIPDIGNHHITNIKQDCGKFPQNYILLFHLVNLYQLST